MVKLTKQQQQVLTNEGLSKSKKMVELYTLGLEVKVISELMGVRYNFVYNVVSNHCNVNGVELRTNKREGDSKKQLIIQMYLNGISNKQISIELQTNYNYVFNTIKQYKQQQAQQTESN